MQPRDFVARHDALRKHFYDASLDPAQQEILRLRRTIATTELCIEHCTGELIRLRARVLSLRSELEQAEASQTYLPLAYAPESNGSLAN